MLVNKINSNIVFRNVNNNFVPNTDNKSEGTLLILKDANTSVKFERNGEVQKMAEPVEKDLNKSLKYKLYKAFAAMTDLNNIKDESNIHLSVLS